jgi:hypothetical protein
MSHNLVSIRELAGWGFDTYEYRPEVLKSESPSPSKAANVIAQRSPFQQSSVVLTVETEKLREEFAYFAKRQDLLSEMSGLSWSLGVVDLRSLLAFQRRLAFGAGTAQPSVPIAGDWPALLELCFGSPKPVEYDVFHDRLTETVIMRSSNPNLHIRVTKDPTHPLIVHGGCPFLEVAHFRDRWFLRDGYHRAYGLLQAQVFEVPAVIVEARTIEELGANQPWFLPEAVLLSDTPPRIVDFLNEDLVLQYDRPPFIKIIRIKLEGTLKPEPYTGERS